MNEKKKRKKNRRLVFWLSLLIVDLLVKWGVREQGSFVENQGVAFGLLIGSYLVWLGLLVWVGIRWWQSRKAEWGWLLTGGVANLIDRLLFGAVTDWIRLPIFELWFNLADAYIVAGVVWMLAREMANLLGLRHGDKEVI